MNLIEQYIVLHYPTKSINVLANEIGLSNTSVSLRIEQLREEGKLDESEEDTHDLIIVIGSIRKEMEALVHFITSRKEGVLVDIAKQRLRMLDQINNY